MNVVVPYLVTSVLQGTTTEPVFFTKSRDFYPPKKVATSFKLSNYFSKYVKYTAITLTENFSELSLTTSSHLIDVLFSYLAFIYYFCHVFRHPPNGLSIYVKDSFRSRSQIISVPPIFVSPTPQHYLNLLKFTWTTLKHAKNIVNFKTCKKYCANFFDLVTIWTWSVNYFLTKLHVDYSILNISKLRVSLLSTGIL